MARPLSCPAMAWVGAWEARAAPKCKLKGTPPGVIHRVTSKTDQGETEVKKRARRQIETETETER